MVAELVGSVGFGLGLGPGFRLGLRDRCVQGPECPRTEVTILLTKYGTVAT